MDLIIIGGTVFVGVFLFCRQHDQKRQLARTVQHYEALFQGDFPKHVALRDAPPAVYEIRRLPGGDACSSD